VKLHGWDKGAECSTDFEHFLLFVVASLLMQIHLPCIFIIF